MIVNGLKNAQQLWHIPALRYSISALGGGIIGHQAFKTVHRPTFTQNLQKIWQQYPKQSTLSLMGAGLGMAAITFATIKSLDKIECAIRDSGVSRDDYFRKRQQQHLRAKEYACVEKFNLSYKPPIANQQSDDETTQEHELNKHTSNAS